MNQYVTGAVIRQLREKNHLTQAELSEKLCVSDKAISKWETGKGFPDISLLEPLAKVFGVSITELLSGIAVTNDNVSANMMRSKFYICPICGNVIHSMGEASISCHGVTLALVEAEKYDALKILYLSYLRKCNTQHGRGKHFLSWGNACTSRSRKSG